MTTNHIDQLTEWWENAEQGTPREGDRLIINEGDGDYAFEQATPGAHEEVDSIRIMSRAPKPKPAWHDAVAIIATGDAGDGDLFTGVWVPEGTHGNWMSADTGIILSTDQFHDVTPLIEAKVTDEMVEAARQEAESRAGLYLERSFVSRMLTAALGLETE